MAEAKGGWYIASAQRYLPDKEVSALVRYSFMHLRADKCHQIVEGQQEIERIMDHLAPPLSEGQDGTQEDGDFENGDQENGASNGTS